MTADWLTLLLFTTLTTALVVNTWVNGGLFDRWREWLIRYATYPPPPAALRKQLKLRFWPDSAILRWLAYGAWCRYCVSHWIGAVVSLLLAPTWTAGMILAAPTILLANYLISTYALVSTDLPRLWTSRVKLDAIEAKSLRRALGEPEEESANSASDAPPPDAAVPPQPPPVAPPH